MACQSPLLKGRKLTDVIQNGSSWQAEKLLRKGADPNQLQPEGIAPFHYAVGQQDVKNVEMTRLFLEYGADPNVRSTEGMTPLHVAATWGNVDCLRLLLLNGGNPELRDQDNLDCLDLATQYGNRDCIELLLEFMTEAESKEDGFCKYTMVPYEDKECLSFLCQDDTSEASKSVFKPKHRRTSLYTSDINDILSSYLLSEESCKDVILDVTSPSHPYVEPRESAKERTINPQGFVSGHQLNGENNIADLTGSSEDSFVTCASEEPNRSFQGGAGEPWSSLTHKLSPLSSSSQPVSNGQSTSRVPHQRSRCPRAHKSYDLTNHNSSTSPGKVCEGMDSETCLEDQFKGIELGDEDSLAHFLPDEFNLSDLTINTKSSNPVSSSDRLSDQSSRGRHSLESGVSSTSTIDYIYSDPEEGITLIERHCPSVSSIHSVRTSPGSAISSNTQNLDESDDTILYYFQDQGEATPNVGSSLPSQSVCCSSSSHSEDSEKTLVKTPSTASRVTPDSVNTPDIPPLLKRLSNVELKNRLLRLGDEPGPITQSTRQTYLIRLVDLENNPELSRIALTADKPGYSTELRNALRDNFCFSGLEEKEIEMVEPFQKPKADRKWREGVLKSSFNYLLLDPRVAQNLPTRAQILGDLETFRTFISAIFYIGKGKRSRPYCHLYEAIKYRNSPGIKKPSEKVCRILDIWSSGLGVISLHIFQNVIPVEAYTREACMVDAIGLNILTNKIRGNYYGPSSTWPANQRRKVGVHLLKKAVRIYLAEGERQICPPDIIGQ